MCRSALMTSLASVGGRPPHGPRAPPHVGGGIQSRAVSCVEEDIQGHVSSADEWKCMYTPKMPTVQPCNIFDCPKWLAQEWSPVTVTSFFVH